MSRKTWIACLSIAALAGCKGVGETPYSEGMPESSAFQLEVTGDIDTEGLSVSADDLGDDSLRWSSQSLSGQLPEYLRNAKDAVRALNQAVARILDPIAELIRSHPQAQVGDSAVFEKDRGNVTFRFTIRKAALNRYGWLLQAKPLGAPDGAYVAVMGGTFVKGELPRRGRGSMGIDLDHLASVDPAFKGQGQLLVGFAHVGGFKILNYGLHDFSPDTGQAQPVDALFSGVRGPAGGTDVRLALHANLMDTPTPAPELAVLHARWIPGVGGRADAIAAQGDVPAGHAIVAFSCWDGNCSDRDGFVWVADCMQGTPPGPNCTVIRTAGMPQNCAPGLQMPALPPNDPNAPAQPEGVPENPPIPGMIPDGSGQ